MKELNVIETQSRQGYPRWIVRAGDRDHGLTLGTFMSEADADAYIDACEAEDVRSNPDPGRECWGI